MSDPDVEHAGWATQGPGSRLRRRRNPALGLLAAALLLGGTGAAVAGVVELATDAGPADDEIVARGVVAALEGPEAPPARFTAPGERPFTVWLDLDATRKLIRDQVIGATACEVTQAGAIVARFRGSRQGTAVAIGSRATVGTFSAQQGSAVVACRQVPFGRRARRARLRAERPFLVVRGRPSERIGGFLLLFGGLAAALLAWPLGQRWNAGRLIETT